MILKIWRLLFVAGFVAILLLPLFLSSYIYDPIRLIGINNFPLYLFLFVLAATYMFLISFLAHKAVIGSGSVRMLAIDLLLASKLVSTALFVIFSFASPVLLISVVVDGFIALTLYLSKRSFHT